MTAGWQTLRLGDVAAIGAGNSAPQDDSLFDGGSIPFFRTSDAGRVRFGDISDSGDHLNEQGASRLKRFPKGTILFPKSGASTFLNHRVMLGVDGCVSSHLATIVADKSKVLPRFVLYYLATVQTQDLVQDHAYPSLTLPIISDIPVRIPPLSEQERIVAILDEAFEGIATAKANAESSLNKSRALFDGYLEQEIARNREGWKDCLLSEVAIEFGRGKSKHRPRNDPVLYGGPYPLIQTGDVRNSDHIITSYSQTYSEAGLAQSKLWPAGSLCITIAANIAETGILGFDSCFPDSVIGFVPDPKKANAKFVEYLLRNYKAVLQAQGKGSAQDNTTSARLRASASHFLILRLKPDLSSRLIG